MSQSETPEERKTRVAAQSRKTLEEKTWPQVMAVFGYQNNKVKRHSSEEFAHLKQKFESAKCPHIVAFIDIVVFDEKQYDVSMSYNLSMRRRLAPGDAEPSPENVMQFFSCPDILVGTRYGVESAFHWFTNLSRAAEQMPPESMQVFNEILGEALAFLRGPRSISTVGEMLHTALTGEDMPRPEKDTKH